MSGLIEPPHIIVNGETYEHKLKDIQFTFVELKKFHKEAHDLKTLVEKWIFFIKNAENLDVIPDNVDDEGLLEAYQDAEKHGWTKAELIAYDNASIAIQDARGRITRAVDQAVEKNNREIIERCWQENMTVETIAKITGIPIEEVQKIVEKIK